MLNASEKFWIQSKPVSSCRALLPVLIASGLNFNLNSPICLTNSLLSSQPLSFLWSAEDLSWFGRSFSLEKNCHQTVDVQLFLYPMIQHDACSWSAALLFWTSQSIPIALLEWDCFWEMGYLSSRRSALDSKYPDNFWPQLQSVPTESVWLFVVVFVSSFVDV